MTAGAALSGHVARYRWVILAVGFVASGSYAATRMGLPALTPQLSHAFGLSFSQVGLLLGAMGAGQLLLTYTWGSLADRVGERLVLVTGLTGGAVALAVGAAGSTVEQLAAGLFVSGMLGGVAQTASGRAVMGWFPRRERGTALGVRQMSLPMGGALASLCLPLIAAHYSLRAALETLAAVMLAGAVVSALGMRRPPGDAEAQAQALAQAGPRPMRNPGLWRLASAVGLLHAAQSSIVGFLVLYLHDERGLSAAGAGATLAALQLVGALARPAAGWWSDRVGQRLSVMSTIAGAAAAMFVAGGLLGSLVPTPVAMAIIVPGGTLALCWNGLAQTAAVEFAGAAHAGAALGLQNTVVSVAQTIAPPVFGAVVEQGGWSIGFVCLAALQMVAVLRLRPLMRKEQQELGVAA